MISVFQIVPQSDILPSSKINATNTHKTLKKLRLVQYGLLRSPTNDFWRDSDLSGKIKEGMRVASNTSVVQSSEMIR